MSLNGDSDKLRAYYADWAQSYDGDVGDAEYGLPRSVLVTIDAATEHEPGMCPTVNTPPTTTRSARRIQVSLGATVRSTGASSDV